VRACDRESDHDPSHRKWADMTFHLCGMEMLVGIVMFPVHTPS